MCVVVCVEGCGSTVERGGTTEQTAGISTYVLSTVGWLVRGWVVCVNEHTSVHMSLYECVCRCECE